MTAPHLQFRHLHADVLTATSALLEAGTSTLPHWQGQDEFQQWADTAAAAYHLPRTAVTTDNGSAGHPATGGHGYIPSPASGTPAIYLRGRSVIDLLKNFRRHMQHHRIPQAAGGPETDAVAWALSLYYTARPRQLTLLAAEGCFPGLTTVACAGAVPASDSTTASLPIDDGMRRAIFAALRDHYGTDLGRDDRLTKLSQFARRPVRTINSLTRAEAGRVLSTLSTLAADPAARQLQAARVFIRRAAIEGRITSTARDRYLTMLNTEHGRAAGAPDALDAIRDRAISLYRDGEICRAGLSDFLRAASLLSYDD
jgi:hypothetical protein